MADIELLTGVLREMVYGEYRPEKMTELDIREWPGLFNNLRNVPGSLIEYAEVRRSDDRLRRFGSVVSVDKEIVLSSPFYVPATRDAKPVHALCVPFRNLIEKECRLIVHVMEMQREQEIITILQYELISLRDELVELLKETRRRGNDSNKLTPSGFIYHTFFTNLFATILELQARFEALYKHHHYTEDQIWLNILGEPVPERSPAVMTTRGLSYRIPRILMESGTLKMIDLILTKLYSEAESIRAASSEMNEVIMYCENLFVFIAAKKGRPDGEERRVDLSDPKKVSGLFESLNQNVKEGGKLDELQETLLQGVEKRVDMIRHHLKMDRPGTASQSVKLIKRLEQFQNERVYRSKNRRGDAPISSDEHEEVSANTLMLNDYYRLEHIQEELRVSAKPFKRYLEESGVYIIQFSDKNRWIHKREVEKLFAYYQQKVK